MSKYKGTLYVVSAPSGAGKTSLIAGVAQSTPNLKVSVSSTTREQRPGEEAGVHYHYVNVDDFKQMAEAGDFLEYATVFHHYYGTSRVWVESQLQEGVDILLEIDWQGARQVRKLFPDNTVSIFIVPPSLEILAERLKARKRDSEEVIKTRMDLASKEISHLNEYKYVIINEEFESALSDMKAIITAERLKCAAQFANKQQILRNLLAN